MSRAFWFLAMTPWLVNVALADDARPDAACSGLRTRAFADTKITTAELIRSGTFKLPGDWGAALDTSLRKLPAFCRVIGVLRPTADSKIGFELWLPEGWNGRYLQVGNAGFAGGIVYSGLIQGLQNDFAVASTDDGHIGDDTGWMHGHPEKVIDYGYRAVHRTSVVAKQIVNAFYNRPIPYSYFSGCSDGGRESLVEAQRYPDDFAGWIVGAPANDWVGLMTFLLNRVQLTAAIKEPFTDLQLKAISAASVARCDNLDGVKDGVIDDPLQCTFDPKKLQCKAGADGQCLSPGQVEVVRRIYDDVKSSAGVNLLPGLQGTRGAEAGNWEFPKIAQEGTAAAGDFYGQIVRGFWSKLVFDDPKLDYTKIDLVDALRKGSGYAANTLSAVDPNLSSIRASGKKIIQYHGWADSAIPAQYSIRYYEAVEKYLGRDNRDFYRLFLAPGMMHCWAGPGPNVFGGAYTPGGIFDPDHHALAALMQWVEKGKAPEKIIATKYQDDDPTKTVIRTRPLCPYPGVARWTGTGSTDDVQNFVCSVQPERPTVDADGTVHASAFAIPLPRYMSEQAKRQFIKETHNPPDADWDIDAPIAKLRAQVDDYYRPIVERAEALYPVDIEDQKIGGISTQIVTPKGGVSAKNRQRVLINLHGGGFAVGAGLGGLAESIPVSGLGKFKVISVDYREAPEYHFPAASEDVASVYTELLKQYQPQNIGVYGCSAGGILSAMVPAWLQKNRLPTPGAIGIFSAGAFGSFSGPPDNPNTWGGDSRFTGPPLVGEAPPSTSGAPAGAVSDAMNYTGNTDRSDPLVSPALSPTVLAKFPPTLLVTGTRAYDMSAAVQTQRELTKVGVEADLHLWDGMGHCFFFDVDLPE